MNVRIANLVNIVNAAAPRETLQKFDIGKIVRTEGALAPRTVDECVADAEARYRAAKYDEPIDAFIAREVTAFLEGRQARYERKYQRVKGNARRRDTYASSQEERDELRKSRPIVAIDSEGQDYDGDDIMHGDVLYKRHGTYLWCATTDKEASVAHILVDPRSSGVDKKELGVEAILDYLLSLPDKYDPVRIKRVDQGPIFVMFGSGYDITQILAKTSLDTAYKVVKREDPENEDTELNAPEFWRNYAFSYIKGKWIDIWKLRDHNAPYTIDHKGKRVLDTIQHIKIYETFGYFQCKFEKVIDDMVKQGLALDDERALISEMKALRGKFSGVELDKITQYCTTECRLLSKRVSQLRELFFELDIRPTGWHGPGALASAVFKKRELRRHFGDDISAENICEQQDWAHHAFVGGRIETLKQGYLKTGALHVYDVSSCYPAGAVELPSLAAANGRWRRLKRPDLAYDSLADLLKMAEGASPMSMFKVRWNFPVTEKRHKPPDHLGLTGLDAKKWEYSRTIAIPFFPLPYRTKTKAILFPAYGASVCMRDDFIAAIKWLQRFAPEFPRKQTLAGTRVVFDVEGAWVWEVNPENDIAYTFDFIRDMYNQRRSIKDEAARTGVYNPMEIVIKLVINSIYGKLAQFIGEKGKVPLTANPYYGAAITAYGRRRLVEAALIKPYSIIFLATDGVVSDEPLHGFDGGLTRVKYEGKDEISLGDWEYNKADGALFVGSGIYIYWKYDLDSTGEPKRKADGSIILKPVAKLRGASVKSYQTNDKGEPWLVEHTLPVWLNMKQIPGDAELPDERNNGKILQDYKQFITVGSALTPNRWRLAGRWSPEPGDANAYKRTINVHDMGVKRMLNIARFWELMNGDDVVPHIAHRTYKLIPTIPTINKDPELSGPRAPDWISEETGESRELEDEIDTIDFAGPRQ